MDNEEILQDTNTKISPEWIAMAYYVFEVVKSVMGDDFKAIAIPDPTGKIKGKPGIVVEVSSFVEEKLGAQFIISLDEEGITNTRRVCVLVANKMYDAEEKSLNQKTGNTSLIVPEKKLYVPS
jgi:hypothetical protein